MVQETKTGKIIPYSLGLLYGISFLIYVEAVWLTPFRTHALVLAVLFLVLFVSCVAVIRLKELGRQVLVAVNGVLCFYFLFLALKAPRFARMVAP